MEQEQTPGAPETSGSPAEGSKNNTKLIIAVVVVVVLGLLVMMGSGRFTSERMIERALEQATDGAVDYDMDSDGSGTVRMDDGAGNTIEFSTGGNVSLPADWPSDIPVIDGAVLFYAGTVDVENGQPASIMFQSKKSLSDVKTYYSQTIADNGWTAQSTMDTGNATVLVIKKGEREVGVYMVESDDGGTTVTMSTN